MKPSISVDERGVLLHVTDAEGKGVAVKLSAETLTELAAQTTLALERLKHPEGIWNLARAIVRELTKPDESTDGSPEPDTAREKDR